MAKSLALGTVLYVANPATTGWVRIGNLTNIGIPSPTKEEIDVTDFDSTAREKLVTLPDNGQLGLSGYFNYADAGQQIMLEDAHDPAAPERDWKIEFERQDLQFEFAGSVLSFQPNASGPDEAYAFDASITVSGAVTTTSPIP